MKLKFFIFLFFVFFISFFLAKKNIFEKKQTVIFHINYTNNTPTIKKEEFLVEIPNKQTNKFLESEFGIEYWKTMKTVLKKQAGLTSFIHGDILSLYLVNGNIRKFALHHYANRSVGKEIVFEKKGDLFLKQERHISLIVRTLVKNFVIKTSFKKDFPRFYQIAKKRLEWDWSLLDKLKKGDSISFVIKGIFDNNILNQIYGILGFSVKSQTIGTFTLNAYRDFYFGDYFSVGNDYPISPPGQFRVPISFSRITSRFGYRKDPFTKRRRFRNGIDLIAEIGTNVHSAADGVVEFVGRKGGYGKCVKINHNNGFETLYAHLNDYYVVKGQNVKMGDIIASSGNTGRSTGPHLHFSVFKNKKAVNPMQFKYERIWAPPIEIADKFRQYSTIKKLALLKSVDKHKSFFMDEYLAENERKQGETK